METKIKSETLQISFNDDELSDRIIFMKKHRWKCSLTILKSSGKPHFKKRRQQSSLDEMATSYNRTSSYNRTYEKRIIEETPSARLESPLRIGSPLHLSTLQTPSLTTPLSSSPGFVTSQHSSEDSFYAQLDVSQFKPEDLKVSVMGQFVVVEAHQPEREDDLGFIERHFIRKFRLPSSIRAEAVTSNLSADGQLSVSATAPKPRTDTTARTVPITLISSPSKADSVSSQQAPSTSGEFTS